MRGLGAATVILTLGSFLGGAAADEIDWRPARPRPVPPCPVALQAVPFGITLGKPVLADAPRAQPVSGMSLADTELVPASFCAPAGAVVRAKAEDVQPVVLPANLTALDAVSLASPSDLVEAPAGKGQPVALIPIQHEVDHAVFPQVDTHWTRSFQAGPGSEFGPLPPGEDEPGPPEVAAARFYASGEYLLWWTKGAVLPPLVTTGTATPLGGSLGQPGTVILFGGSTVEYGPQSGGRFTAGYWLDCEQTVAIEGSLFFLGQGTVPFSANSVMFPVLARPIVALNPPVAGEFRELAAFPGQFSGAINASTASRLGGAEVNARCKGCCGCLDDCTYRIDWLAGVRYLELNENLNINESLQFLPGVISTLPNGGTGSVFDSFGTRNQFFGAQVGTSIELCHGPWFLDVKAKLAVGDTHETVNINGGQQLVSTAGVVTNFPGGLLAQPSNIGRFTRDVFGVVPEVGLQLGYQVTDHFRVMVGYNFLFWSDVLRAGEQVDRNIDLTQIPAVFQPPGIVPVGQTRPAVLFRENSYWAQGLTAGLEWRY